MILHLWIVIWSIISLGEVKWLFSNSVIPRFNIGNCSANKNSQRPFLYKLGLLGYMEIQFI
jgi:hypothetical protein